jgi:hypothetical protein
VLLCLAAVLLLSLLPTPTCSRADFQHHVCVFDAGLVHNGLNHQRVFEDVLTLALVELQAGGARGEKGIQVSVRVSCCGACCVC